MADALLNPALISAADQEYNAPATGASDEAEEVGASEDEEETTGASDEEDTGASEDEDGAALLAGAEELLLPLQATTPNANNAIIALQNFAFFISFPF